MMPNITKGPILESDLDRNSVMTDGISVEALKGSRINTQQMSANRIHLSKHLQESALKVAVDALEEISAPSPRDLRSAPSPSIKARKALEEIDRMVMSEMTGLDQSGLS